MYLLKSVTGPRTLFVLAVILVAGLAPPALALVVTDGRLTANDPSNLNARPGCHYRIMEVKFTAGATYQIDLMSDDFDAYLILANDRGNILAQDDDSGGGLDARIVFRAGYTGTYRIVVTTFGQRQRGNYKLRVSP